MFVGVRPVARVPASDLYSVASGDTVFARGEIGGMPAHHLHALEYSTSIFAVGKVQFGYVRHLRTTKGLLPGLGGMFAVSLLPPELAPRYSGHAVPSFGVFFGLQAARHRM